MIPLDATWSIFVGKIQFYHIYEVCHRIFRFLAQKTKLILIQKEILLIIWVFILI